MREPGIDDCEACDEVSCQACPFLDDADDHDAAFDAFKDECGEYAIDWRQPMARYLLNAVKAAGEE